jgi:hypothetical protein
MDAESFRRLGAYLSQHAETCPRARRERLEWLGDAVLRDLVARHVAERRGPEQGQQQQQQQQVEEGEEEGLDDAQSCTSRRKSRRTAGATLSMLCDRCCANATLALAWDRARAVHLSRKRRRWRRAGDGDGHATKWKADMVESALGALVVQCIRGEQSAALTLDMIDVLLSGVLRAAAWRGGSGGSGLEVFYHLPLEATAVSGKQRRRKRFNSHPMGAIPSWGRVAASAEVPPHLNLVPSTLQSTSRTLYQQCERQDLGWNTGYDGVRNTNMFGSLGSDEDEEESADSSASLDGDNADDVEDGDPSTTPPAPPQDGANVIKTAAAEIVGAAALRASLSLAIFTRLGPSATPNVLTRERQRIMSRRDQLWGAALSHLEKRAVVWFDTTAATMPGPTAYLWAAAATRGEWLGGPEDRLPLEPEVRSPLFCASSLSSSSSFAAATTTAAVAVATRKGGAALPVATLTALCRYMADNNNGNAGDDNNDEPVVASSAASAITPNSNAHYLKKEDNAFWRTSRAYSRSREAAEIALQSVGLALSPQSPRPISTASKRKAADTFLPPPSIAKRRRRSHGLSSSSAGLSLPVTSSTLPPPSRPSRSLSASARDLALLSRFAGHEELLNAVEKAIHWDADPSGAVALGSNNITQTKPQRAGCLIVLDDPLERKLAHALIAAHGVKSTGETAKGARRAVRVKHTQTTWERLRWPSRDYAVGAESGPRCRCVFS